MDICPKDDGAEHKRMINKPAFGVRVSGMEHVRGKKDQVAFFGGEGFAATGKLPHSAGYVIQLKLTVPVHGNAHEGVGKTAFVIAVWNIGGAVLPHFPGFVSW